MAFSASSLHCPWNLQGASLDLQESKTHPLVPHGSLRTIPANKAMSVACFNRVKLWRTFLGGCSRTLFLQSQMNTTKLRTQKSEVGVREGFEVYARGKSNIRTSAVAAESSTLSKEKESFKWPDSKRPRICVLGGGFGGLYTALRLESLIWQSDKRPQVVVVDQSDRFVFKPLLYEIISKEVEEWEIAPRFTELLAGTEAQFVRGTVKEVFPGEDPRVVLDTGLELNYDWLVLSLGAEVRKEMVPGAKEYAQAFATLEDALETERKLLALERWRVQKGGVEGGVEGEVRVAIVGGGYSGVELAATVAQRLGARGRVQIVDPSPDIIKSAPKGNQEAARKILASRNVELLLSTRVESLSAAREAESGPQAPKLPPTAAILNVVKGDNNDTFQINSDLVLWTVGIRATVPPTGEGTREGEGEGEECQNCFPISGRGQAETENTLRVRGYENVFALGDSASFTDQSGKVLASTAQVAFQQSDYVAWNLWASINKRPLLPFRYQHLGDMMTLGTSEAAVSLGFVDGITLEGPLGHAARKLAYLYRQPTVEHMARVGGSWLAKAALDTLARVQDSLALALGPQR